MLDALVPLLPQGVHERARGDRTEVAFYEPTRPGARARGAAGDSLLAARRRSPTTRRAPARCTAAAGDRGAAARALAEDPPAPAPAARARDRVRRGAFGAGAHPTTRMCLELLLGLEPGGPFADLGCGAGVLAIAAARLGWAPVFAVDHEPRSVDATRAQRGAQRRRARRCELDLLDGRRRRRLRRSPRTSRRPSTARRDGARARGHHVIASGLVESEHDEVVAGSTRRRASRARARLGDGWQAVLLERARERAARPGRGRGAARATASSPAGCPAAGWRSCHKLVEDGARAMMLLAPGLFRLDVRPVEDTLQVMTRSLHEGARWGTEPAAATDYGQGRRDRPSPRAPASPSSPSSSRSAGQPGLDRSTASAARPLRAQAILREVPGWDRCAGAREYPRTRGPRGDRAPRLPAGRRGYDPAAVDAHLRRVADEFEACAGRAGPAGRARRGRRRAGALDPRGRRDERPQLREDAGREASDHVERVEEAAQRRCSPSSTACRPSSTGCSTACARDGRSARRLELEPRRRPDAGPAPGAGRAPPSPRRRAGRRQRRAAPTTRPARASSRSTWRSRAPRARRPRATWPSTTSWPTSRPARRRLRERRQVSAPARARRAARARDEPDRPRPRPLAAVLGPEHDDAAGRRRARGDHSATLERVATSALTDPELGRAARRARAVGGRRGPRRRRRAPRRELRRDFEKAVRVPTELAAEMSRAARSARQAWQEARAAADFSRFRDALERHIELRHRYVDCFEGFEHPYDVLLDDFEPGMTTAELRPLFAELRDGLVPLVAGARRPTTAAQRRPFGGPYEVEDQRRAVMDMLEGVGFDPDGWRLDVAPHPFAQRSAAGDVRITTRYDLHDFGGAYFGALHEFGHGSTRRGSPTGSRAARSASRSRSACTSRRAGCGRTSSAAARRSAPGRCRGCAAHLPGSRRHDRRRLYRGVNTVQPHADPRRGRRDDLQPPHRPALRARAGADRGRLAVDDLPHAWNEGCTGCSGSTSPTTPRACSRTSTGAPG